MSAYDRFYRNRHCACARCRIASAIGPAVLITLGVLFLLDTQGWVHFDRTWPALLIVIGVVKVLAHSASTAGHVPPPMVAWVPQAVPPPTPASPGSTPVGFAPSAPPEASGGGKDHV